jgi:hypothetical protein
LNCEQVLPLASRRLGFNLPQAFVKRFAEKQHPPADANSLEGRQAGNLPVRDAAEVCLGAPAEGVSAASLTSALFENSP